MDKKTTDKLLSSDYETTISLLNVYLTEWCYREEFMWLQLFRFYFAILIVSLFPNLYNAIGVEELPNVPKVVFRIIGIILSFVYYYVALAYAARFQAISDTYRSVIVTFPKEYQREDMNKTKFRKFLSKRITYLVCSVLFITLITVPILLLILDI